MTIVRSFFDALSLPGVAAPYQGAHLRIYYPALMSDTPEARNTGELAVDPSHGPLPVVIFMPGMNIDPAGYRWLATRLAEAGMVCICYQIIAEPLPGHLSLTPGLDVGALTPDTYGQQVSSPILAPLAAKLQQLNQQGRLAGQLALDQVILGGHSAGGMAALMNNRPEWLPGLKACFSYGAHLVPSTMLGWPENTVLPICSDTPSLIMGGDADGCIANSGGRYGEARVDPCQRLSDSFERALHNTGKHLLLLLRGANHFTLTDPLDTSTGRHFIDGEGAPDQAALRQLIGDTCVAFVRASLEQDASALAQLTEQLKTNAACLQVQQK